MQWSKTEILKSNSSSNTEIMENEKETILLELNSMQRRMEFTALNQDRDTEKA